MERTSHNDTAIKLVVYINSHLLIKIYITYKSDKLIVLYDH